MEFARLLAGQNSELKKILEQEFHQTADLDGEGLHDALTHAAGLGAKPIPDLEFHQTVGCDTSR